MEVGGFLVAELMLLRILYKLGSDNANKKLELISLLRAY
jgi:hypothetical protein